MKIRCKWCLSHPLLTEYHDKEWGVPQHNDGKLFEFIVLEISQAGLSWITVLKKRENYRKAFDNFDVKKIAKYDERKVNELLKNKGIIRNKLKINAVIQNAKVFIEIQKEFGSFDKYMWKFANYKVKKNSWKTEKEIPAKTKESEIISNDLIKRGFRFFGATICYAHMQAVGMVNDHLVSCFRYREVGKKCQ